MVDQGNWAGAREIAAELGHVVRSLRERVFQNIDRVYSIRNSTLSSSLDATSVLVLLVESDTFNRARALVDDLDEYLVARDFEYDAIPLPGGQAWGLGSIDLRFSHLEIYGGFLEPTLRRTIVDFVPDRVVAFLTKIGKGDDFLKKEYHGGVGWHYHYLDRTQRRSDVVLSWDIRADTKKIPRPLFSEKHAEGKKDFPARPDSWGNKKRVSMYEACKPDLSKWPLHEFRSPSNRAAAVWPTGAVLTPAPATSPSANFRFPAKSNSKRRQQ